MEVLTRKLTLMFLQLSLEVILTIAYYDHMAYNGDHLYDKASVSEKHSRAENFLIYQGNHLMNESQ